jgi:PAS domain S-box-containing protein
MVKSMSGKVPIKGTDIFLPGFSKEQLLRFKNYYTRAFSVEVFTEIEYPDTPSGPWSEISYYPIYKDDKVIGTACFSRDITEAKKAELKILENEQILKEHIERYDIVSKATNDAIWDWDIVKGRMIWNHGMQTIFGYSEREIKDTHDWWGTKIHLQDFNRINNEIKKVFVTKGNLWISNYQYKCADESYKHVLDRAYVIYHKNKPIRMIGIMQDITEVVEYREGLERMVEERTQKLNEALLKEKELVQMKSKFVSIASHEFRTPLSTIALATGFIKKYQHKIKPADLNKKLGSIEKQVDNMTYLLDDVLTIGKADAGKIEVTLRKVKISFLKKLADEVIASAGTQHKLNYKLNCKITSITTSEKLIRNIIINLFRVPPALRKWKSARMGI